MFVLGDCQNKTKLTDLECVVKETNYAEWLKVSASVGFCSAELPEPYKGNWSKDLEDLQKTKLILGEGCNLKANSDLKAIVEGLEWKGEK